MLLAKASHQLRVCKHGTEVSDVAQAGGLFEVAEAEGSPECCQP